MRDSSELEKETNMATKEAVLDTPESVAGLEVEEKTTPSQETEQPTKVDEQPSATEQSQVETTVSNASSTEKESRKPIEFYRERKDIKHLKEMIQNLAEQIKSSQVSVPKTTQTPTPQTAEQFLANFQNDPEGTLRAGGFNSLSSEQVSKLIEEKLEMQKIDGKRQEALEMVRTSKFAKTDPEYFDSISGIIDEFGLDYYGMIDPKAAIQKALELYELRKGKVVEKPHNEFVPTKAQMSAIPSGSVQVNSANTKNQLAHDLLKQATAEPYLFHNDDWVKKWNEATA